MHTNTNIILRQLLNLSLALLLAARHVPRFGDCAALTEPERPPLLHDARDGLAGGEGLRLHPVVSSVGRPQAGRT